MADEADDEVLELDPALELQGEEQDGEQAEGDEVGDEDGETGFAFSDEEGAAPAPEQESSVIRNLRKALREKERLLTTYQRENDPKPIEVGPEPELSEEYGWDQDRWKVDWLKWKDRKEAADRQANEVEQRQRAIAEEWNQRAETYKASKQAAKIPGIDDAEEVVKAALSDQHFALLMLAPEEAPKLIAALANSPGKLDELSKLDLARAAMKVGELKGMVKTVARSKPSPDKPLRGGASFNGSTDKQLARLQEEARQTGDYTKYYAAKRAAA